MAKKNNKNNNNKTSKEKTSDTKSEDKEKQLGWIKLKSETYKTLGFDDPTPYKIFRNVTLGEVDKQASGNVGFYYDSQVNDPFLSVTLHANTVMEKIEENGVVKDYQWVYCKDNLLDPVSPNVEGSKHYSAEPLARSILTEDFAYQITNNFTDNNMGNAIEDMFTSAKPYAPILAKIGKIGDSAKEVSKANDFGSALVAFFNSLAKKAAPWINSASSFLNKALLVQGTRFSYYNGTQFNFNNLEMKYTVFSEYDSTGTFYSVDDHIKKISPYVMGTYHTFSNYEKSSEILDKVKSASTDLAKFIEEYVGIQDPPGGFEMDTRILTNVLKGTLRLNIGGVWALENLVLKNMAVNMSKVQAKDPRDDRMGETVPLYAEIILQLAPASTAIDTTWRNIIQHKGLEKIRGAVTEGYARELGKLLENQQFASKYVRGGLDTGSLNILPSDSLPSSSNTSINLNNPLGIFNIKYNNDPSKTWND